MMEEIGQTKFTKKQLENILQRQLGRDLVVEDCTSAPNTKAGDNYGSVMLALKVTLRRTKDSPVENLHVVAKLAPPTEFLQIVFDCPKTFCKEMNIYKLVAPEFEKLQKESVIPEEDFWNNLANYYGAQTSLTGDQDPVADLNAVLLLENLKIRGYKLADRLEALDLKHCELVLTKLAQFHALPIALRQKKPEVYKKTVLKATAPFKLGGTLASPEGDIEKIIKSLRQNLPESIPYLERLRKQCIDNHIHGNDHLQKEPFATIVHNDLWTNNIMFFYSENSSPTDVKFVDFQVTLLCSPVKDLIFFLFSSTTDEVFNNHFNHLVNHYHTSLLSMLGKLGCDTSPFSFKAFQNEINEFAPTQLYHILFMLSGIYMEQSDVQELSDLDGSQDMKIASGETCKRKTLTLIEEFDRRGWLGHDSLTEKSSM